MTTIPITATDGTIVIPIYPSYGSQPLPIEIPTPEKVNWISQEDKDLLYQVFDELDSKQPSGSYADLEHSHQISGVTNLQTELDSKQPSGDYQVAGDYASEIHNHSISGVTGLQSELDGKQPIGSYQPSGDYQPAGDYASTIHNHLISSVTGLQTELDGKQPIGSYQPSGDYELSFSNRTALELVSGTNTGDQEIPTTLPASDVYPWAKTTSKPTYTYSEIVGTIPTDDLPPIAITKVVPVYSENEQMELTSELGDVAVRVDINKCFMNNGGSAGNMSDWQELLTPLDTIASVNGKVGAVTLTQDDIGVGSEYGRLTLSEVAEVSDRLFSYTMTGASNENAFTIDYTVNKSAGSDYGLYINRNDVSSPATGYLMWLASGGAGKFYITDTGGVFTVSAIQTASGLLPASSASELSLNYFGGNTQNLKYIKTNLGTYTQTGGQTTMFAIMPTYNQVSGNASNTDLLINRNETAVGTGTQLLIDAKVNDISKFTVNNIGIVDVSSEIKAQTYTGKDTSNTDKFEMKYNETSGTIQFNFL